MKIDDPKEYAVRCRIHQIEEDEDFVDNRVIFSALDDGRPLAANSSWILPYMSKDIDKVVLADIYCNFAEISRIDLPCRSIKNTKSPMNPSSQVRLRGKVTGFIGSDILVDCGLPVQVETVLIAKPYPKLGGWVEVTGELFIGW